MCKHGVLPVAQVYNMGGPRYDPQQPAPLQQTSHSTSSPLTMQFTVLALALSALVSQAAALPTTLMQRQIVAAVHGSISAPAQDAPIAPGEPFAFDFQSVNYCESGYEPVTVYLFENEPDVSQMNADGSFNETLYLYKFGQWLIPNFGTLPLMYRLSGSIMLTYTLQVFPLWTRRPRRRTSP